MSQTRMFMLDLACGKGGDIRKVPKGVKYYFGVDLSYKSLEDFNLRVQSFNQSQKISMENINLHLLSDDLRDCTTSFRLINKIITDWKHIQNKEHENRAIKDYENKCQTFLEYIPLVEEMLEIYEKNEDHLSIREDKVIITEIEDDQINVALIDTQENTENKPQEDTFKPSEKDIEVYNAIFQLNENWNPQKSDEEKLNGINLDHKMKHISARIEKFREVIAYTDKFKNCLDTEGIIKKKYIDNIFKLYDDTNLISARRFKKEYNLDNNHQMNMFSIVNCQFSLNYIVDTYDSLRKYLKFVSTALKPNGIFVGTCTDDFSILSKIFNSKSRIIKNKYYELAFGEDEFIEIMQCLKDGRKPKNRIFEYEFYLQDSVGEINYTIAPDGSIMESTNRIPEYLIIFDEMIQIANEFDLELIVHNNLCAFYFDQMEKTRGQFGRDGTVWQKQLDRIFKDPNYKVQPDQDMWDIISLYKMFIFQKKNLEQKESGPEDHNESLSDAEEIDPMLEYTSKLEQEYEDYTKNFNDLYSYETINKIIYKLKENDKE